MKSQLSDITRRSSEMMNVIITKHPNDKIRQGLAWRLRREVLNLQRTQKTAQKLQPTLPFNYSIFLSQSYDDDWTDPVREAAIHYFECNGINPIIASKEVVSGPSIIAKVLKMIKSSEGLLCVLTPSKSDPNVPSSWQITEIALAVACGKPIGFLVDNSVKVWAQNYYGALYNFITCPNDENLIDVIDKKIQETMIVLESEICTRHTEDVLALDDLQF